jgi:hypothetical protein
MLSSCQSAPPDPTLTSAFRVTARSVLEQPLLAGSCLRLVQVECPLTAALPTLWQPAPSIPIGSF